ncbi:MAG: hypothetical protein JWO23_110 [Solirubrobacterales bacterium]|nr:hypothetical protein [Solirubrobacterales bacterium]
MQAGGSIHGRGGVSQPGLSEEEATDSSAVADDGDARGMAARVMYGVARRLLPRKLRRGIISLTQYPATRRLVGDLRSFRAYRILENPPARMRESGATVAVRFRELGGAAVRLRPFTDDDSVARDAFSLLHHAPPAGVPLRDMENIWDLGANVGITMAHLAVLCPRAHIVGVELDSDNAAICRENVAPWNDRCEVMCAGVWTSTGTVSYERPTGRVQSFHVVEEQGAAVLTEAPSISLNALLAHGQGAIIDYVKMDIEGAERPVLSQNTEWVDSVLSIKVELHGDYTVPDCIVDLEGLGFQAAPIPRHHAAVVGVRSAADRARILGGQSTRLVTPAP